MTAYTPLFIGGNSTGLVQDREEMILPADAYPTLENAFVWRERIKRKQGYQLLGRLRRVLTSQLLGNADGSGNFSGNLITIFSLEVTAQIQPGSVVVTDAGPVHTFTDNGLGVLVGSPSGSGTINYITSAITISGASAGAALTVNFNYYPTLPVMGIRSRDLSPINNEMTVFFDTKYAYNFTASGFVEFITGTTWSSGLPNANSNFFWSTNYWTSLTNVKLFWVTNFNGTAGNPIRYTDGTTWTDFGASSATGTGLLDPVSGIFLNQCLCLLPFRNRLVAFNTYEGTSLATSINYSNRIRWAQIGNPLTVDSVGPPMTIGAWRDDPAARGKGGFIDIPTNEDIITVGFVRDNLVIYCENSTWQLRYTGRSIAPFQIEKVNTELGAGSTFSVVQFDTSLVGIGDKGVVQCDSFQSQRMDVKIPDLVMNHINNNNFGQKRVHGIRDFLQRLAYWIYPESDNNGTFPDRRLVYNYENDSWAIFTDSLTALGTYQPVGSRTWANPTGGDPSIKVSWKEANFPWTNKPSAILSIVGGNQQGYVEYLDEQTTNDQSLTITAITGNTTTSTQITSPNHNLQTGAVIKIVNIPTGTPFASSLNNKIFEVKVVTSATFLLDLYDPTTGGFTAPQLDPPGTYIGGGEICVRDNFSVLSKKFNFLEQGENIQIGYIDILMPTVKDGAISMNIYANYDGVNPVNTGNPFFNTTISTASNYPNATSPINPSTGSSSTKSNQRVFCATRGNYLTIQYTLSNAQMNGVEQERDVQIDMQVLWQRPAGRIQTL